MSTPYVGEIQAFPFAFALDGFNNGTWAPCAGQLLPIRQNAALFSLIGVSYGGNGTVTFALPNLMGSVAISQGQGPGLSMRDIGEQIGSSAVTLTGQEMAAHTHILQLGLAASPGASPGPGDAGTSAAIDPTFNGFVAPPTNTTLAPNAIFPAGNGEAHNNMQPYQALVWCIAMKGNFPSFG